MVGIFQWVKFSWLRGIPHSLVFAHILYRDHKFRGAFVGGSHMELLVEGAWRGSSSFNTRDTGSSKPLVLWM